jgi:Leucine-rich repeat (LRR) protein
MAYLAKLESWKRSAPPECREECYRIAAEYENAYNCSGGATLEIENVSSLDSLPPIPPTVTSLKVVNCTHMNRFPDLSACKNLEYLIVTNCPRLTAFPDLARCKELQRLKCRECPGLTGRLDLLKFTQLTHVIWDCPVKIRVPPSMVLIPSAPPLARRSTQYAASGSVPSSRAVPDFTLAPAMPNRRREAVTQPPSYTLIPPSAFNHDLPIANSTGAPGVRSAPVLAPTTTGRQREAALRPPSGKPIVPSASSHDDHDAALTAINTWESMAPEEYRQAYRDIAKRITEVWNDKSKTSLAISNPNITSLPPLPSHLTELSLLNCGSLNELPDLSACRKLKTLQLAGCEALAELPDLTAHKGLRQVNLMGVIVGGDAQRILGLSEECSVMLEASRVTHEVYVQLNQAIADQGYRGPKIRFMRSSFGSGRLSSLRTLTNEVKSWMPDADDNAWRNIEKEMNAHLFSQYLGSIRETADYKEWQPVTTKRVTALLRQLQRPENQALREACFNIALVVTDTCGDGIAMALLNMNLLCMTYQAQADVKAGKYDNRLAGLFALSKGLHLYESLKKIADDKALILKAESKESIDETEVTYGYLLRFSTAFSRFLGIELKTMLYERDSKITHEDVKAAADVLRGPGHQDEWLAFVATWSPMDSLLTRLGHKPILDKVSSRIEAEQERIGVAMDELFDSREKLTSQEYKEKLRELTLEYGNLEKKISVEEKGAVITGLLKQYRVDARLL